MLKAKKYKSYKLSGIDFIEDIPEHWEVKKLKYIIKFQNGFAFKSNLFSDNGINIIRIGDISHYVNLDKCKKSKERDVDKIFKINKLDSLIALSGATTGKTCFIDINLNDTYINQRVAKFNYQNKFLYYVVISDLFQELIFLGADGSAQENISTNKLENIAVTLPPLKEQEKIAQFLDTKNQQIEEFIKEKQKQIALLQEQKEAIINKAVTKGLDETVELKDSGIEWIGDIPKHWSIRKLKYCVIEKLRYGANESAELDNIDYPRYIRITDFGYDGKLRDDTFRSLHPDVAKNYLLAEGDILFARSGATVGKTFQFKNYNGQACFAGYLIKATVNTSIMYSDFLFLFTKSSAYSKWKDFIFNKATIENIGADKYNELQLTLPSLIEQKAIVKYTETEQLKIDKVINQIQKEIDLIKEYKISLISEVVTGQIDVR